MQAWGKAAELARLDRGYWQLKRLQTMPRGDHEHTRLAQRLISKGMLSRAFMEPVVTAELRCGRTTCTLLPSGAVSAEASEGVERLHMLFAS